MRQPSEEEWARVSVYARRIRHFSGFSSVVLSEAALEILTSRFSGTCMLPMLQDVRWISASPEHLGLLPLVVSPVLTNFRLGLSHIDDPFNASQLIPALEALAPAHNSLVEINICHPIDHDPRITDAASTLLLRCNPDRLLYFRVPSALSEEAFLHAAQLPNLRAFTVWDDVAEHAMRLPTSIFPSLRSLDIRTTSARSGLLQAIRNIQSNTFSDLELEFPASILGTFLPMALEALRPRSLHRTLSRLTISPENFFDLDTALIRPLLFLNQLTDLDIGVFCLNTCPFKLTDEDIEELVRALPKLESLRFGHLPCSHPANSTVKSLVSIAKHCKHLNDLVIHTNVEAIVNEASQPFHRGDDHVPEDPLSAFVECPLHTIILGSCHIPDYEQGASIFAFTLLRLFPRLNSILAISLNREEDPLWETVYSFVDNYRRVGMNITEVGEWRVPTSA